MKKQRKNIVALELTRIAKAHGATTCKAEWVVEAARPKSSPLHSKFNWDDAAAGHQYRLWQARQLISVTIITVVNKPTQMFVSLRQDRHPGGAGYRTIVDVMNDDQLRASLLDDAKAEMRHFTLKYRKLTELAKVVEEMDKVLRQPTQKQLAAAASK